MGAFTPCLRTLRGPERSSRRSYRPAQGAHANCSVVVDFHCRNGRSSGFGPLLAIRFLFGAGEAGAFPNCTATVSRWIPYRNARGQPAYSGWPHPLVEVSRRCSSCRSNRHMVGERLFSSSEPLGCSGSQSGRWWFRDTPAEKSGVSPENSKLIGQPAGTGHDRAPVGSHVAEQQLSAFAAHVPSLLLGSVLLSVLAANISPGWAAAYGKRNEDRLFSSSLAGVVGVIVGGISQRSSCAQLFPSHGAMLDRLCEPCHRRHLRHHRDPHEG